jgi:hypothetical protein
MKRLLPLFATTKTIHRLAAGVLIFGMLVTQVTASPVIRIKFKPGATVAAVAGRLRGEHDIVHYVLRVRANQHMHISVDSTQLTFPAIGVVFPSGEDTGTPLGREFDTDATQAGDYRIDVFVRNKEAYEGRKTSIGTFVLSITVD